MKTYVVAHWEQGILEVGSYDDCKLTYDQECEDEKKRVQDDGEFMGGERVILAEVKNHLFAEPTEETIDNDEVLWAWKEENS